MMPSLPLPMITALVLGFLLVRMWHRERRLTPLAALLALCAVHVTVISLAQHYGVAGMQMLQPVSAALLPPVAWGVFLSTTVRPLVWTDGLHLAGPLLALLCLTLQPYALDLLIPALFLGYGLAIMLRVARGADALPLMRLEVGNLPARIWGIIGFALALSALSDAAIVAVQIAGAGWLQPWIVSLYSAGALGAIGALSLSDALRGTDGQAVAEEPQLEPPPDTTVQDTEIMARLAALMQTQKPYLNPDLTLTQLSRRLIVPVKQLSGAINRSTGQNVSRYINAARIEAAQDALRAGEPVTTAMLEAGFNTKSNFNREFLRVTGLSPRDWVSRQNLP